MDYNKLANQLQETVDALRKQAKDNLVEQVRKEFDLDNIQSNFGRWRLRPWDGRSFDWENFSIQPTYSPAILCGEAPNEKGIALIESVENQWGNRNPPLILGAIHDYLNSRFDPCSIVAAENKTLRLSMGGKSLLEWITSPAVCFVATEETMDSLRKAVARDWDTMSEAAERLKTQYARLRDMSWMEEAPSE